MQRPPVDRDPLIGIRNGLILSFPLWAGIGLLAAHALRALR